MKHSQTIICTLISFFLFSHSIAFFGIGSGQDDNREKYKMYSDQRIYYQKHFSFDSAHYFADSMIFLAKSINDPDLLANAIRIKGTVYKKSGNFDSAFYYLHKSLIYSKQNNLFKQLAAAETTIGNIFLLLGESDSAILYQERSMQNYTLAGDSLGIAFASNNLGTVFKVQGNFEKALSNFLLCESIYETLGKKTRMAYVQLNIGNIYLKMDEHDKAIELFQKCYEVSKSNKNFEMIIKALINLGIADNQSGNYEEAKKAYLEAIEIRKLHTDYRSLATLYADLAFVYGNMNSDDLEYDYIVKALALAKKSGSLQVEVQCLNFLGVYYKERGNYTKAEKYFIEAIGISTTHGYLDRQSVLYHNLSDLYEKKGQMSSSLRYFKLYKSISDSILNESKFKIISELHTKYEKKNDETRILQLRNEMANKELEKEDIRLERNTILGTGTTLIIILILSLVIYRIRNRKNKVISEQKIQQLEDEKNLLEAQSVIVGQENERKRIAQELHDGIGVLISTAKIHFGKVLKNTKDSATLDLVKKADKLLKDAGEEVRGISHNMMPGVLSKFGLADAIEDLFDEVADSGKVEVDIDLKVMEERLPENTEVMLFRVVQEMVNNTLKYAEAKHITISAKKQNSYLHLQYTDDGKGFDEKAVLQNKSLGISGIRSRINFLKGKVQLKSSEGKGTVYLISIPV